MDKSPYGKWNPIESTSNSEITNGATITLRMPSVAIVTNNSITVDSITDRGSTNNFLEAGMVLKKYNDGTERILDPPAIVTSVTPNYDASTPPNLVSYTVNFKTYDGSTALATGTTPSIDTITALDDLYFYQFPMNGLSPNSARNLNYFRNIVGSGAVDEGTAAIGYTLEWLEEKSSRSEEHILPKNPAIWETKPKEDTADLDIYYEASGLIPIEVELTNENIQDHIPIGSVVEYENKPDLFPAGTTIIDINAEREEIILSNSIKIVDTQWQLVSYPQNNNWAT